MVLFEERQPSGRAWSILLVVCAVAWLGLWLAVERDTVVLPTVLVVMLGGITALTMWSTGLYGNIRLTDAQLRVGRERIPLDRVNPWSVSGPGQEAQGRLAGGAYAPTIGARAVGVVRRDGQAVMIATKDPERLRQALERALAPYRTSD